MHKGMKVNLSIYTKDYMIVLVSTQAKERKWGRPRNEATGRFLQAIGHHYLIAS